MGFFEKIKEGLAKTKKSMSGQLNGIFAAFTGANEEFFEELEETLILADIGAQTTMEAVEELREITKREGYRSGEDIKNALIDILTEKISVGDTALKLGTKPSVILVIGVKDVYKRQVYVEGIIKEKAPVKVLSPRFTGRDIWRNLKKSLNTHAETRRCCRRHLPTAHTQMSEKKQVFCATSGWNF